MYNQQDPIYKEWRFVEGLIGIRNPRMENRLNEQASHTTTHQPGAGVDILHGCTGEWNSPPTRDP
jgi:hypothetical protein